MLNLEHSPKVTTSAATDAIFDAPLAARLADPEVAARREAALAKCRNGIGIFSGHRQVEPDTSISAEMVERACRAHWTSFDRMRPDHAAEKRVKMQAALAAALYGGRLAP